MKETWKYFLRDVLNKQHEKQEKTELTPRDNELEVQDVYGKNSHVNRIMSRVTSYLKACDVLD